MLSKVRNFIPDSSNERGKRNNVISDDQNNFQNVSLTRFD